MHNLYALHRLSRLSYCKLKSIPWVTDDLDILQSTCFKNQQISAARWEMFINCNHICFYEKILKSKLSSKSKC